MKFDVSWLPEGAGPLMLAGIAGGVVRWATLRERWPDGLISILVGTLCAVFAGPAAFPLMGWVADVTRMNADSARSLAGFLIGAGGILVSGFIIDIWKERRREFRKGGGLTPAAPENFVVIPPPEVPASNGPASQDGDA